MSKEDTAKTLYALAAQFRPDEIDKFVALSLPILEELTTKNK